MGNVNKGRTECDWIRVLPDGPACHERCQRSATLRFFLKQGNLTLYRCATHAEVFRQRLGNENVPEAPVQQIPDDITASDFCEFWVSDSVEACSSCDCEPSSRPAPIVIKDKHFCLWCSVEMARDLLEGV